MDKKIFKFYELYTEHGTLYVYETYKDGEGSYPETREFFTNEVAQRGYDTLVFNDGKCSFRTSQIKRKTRRRKSYYSSTRTFFRRKEYFSITIIKEICKIKK